MLRVELCHLSN